MATSKRTSPAAVSALLKRNGWSPIPSGQRRLDRSGIWVEAWSSADAQARVVLKNTTGACLVDAEVQLKQIFKDAGLHLAKVAHNEDATRIEFYVGRRPEVTATTACGRKATQIDGQPHLWLVPHSEAAVWAIELNDGADITSVDIGEISAGLPWRIIGSADRCRRGWAVEHCEGGNLFIQEELLTQDDALEALLSALDAARPARDERRLAAKLTLQWDLLAIESDYDREKATCFWSGADNANLTMFEEGIWVDGGTRERGSRWYEVALSGYQSLMDEGMYTHLKTEA